MTRSQSDKRNGSPINSSARMRSSHKSLSFSVNRNSLRNLSNSSSKVLTEDEERKKQIMEVWVMCEEQRQMHRLAFMYYNYRQYRYHVFPLTVITMFSGIMAFLTTADMIPSSWKQYLSLSVGILSVLSASVQSVNQEARYDSKAEMHKNAGKSGKTAERILMQPTFHYTFTLILEISLFPTTALGMKRISDQIQFIQVDPSLKLTLSTVSKDQTENGNDLNGKEPSNNSHNDNTNNSKHEDGMTQVQLDETQMNEDNEKTAHTSATFKQVYQQCLDSCQSQIPVEISQAFKMAESRLALSLTAEDKATIHKEFGYLGKQIIHSCLFNEVFCATTDTYFFPWKTPRPNDVVEIAMENVSKCFQTRQITFQRAKETTPLIS